MKQLKKQKTTFDLATSISWWQRNGSFNYQLYLSIINLKHNAKN